MISPFMQVDRVFTKATQTLCFAAQASAEANTHAAPHSSTALKYTNEMHCRTFARILPNAPFCSFAGICLSPAPRHAQIAILMKGQTKIEEEKDFMIRFNNDYNRS